MNNKNATQTNTDCQRTLHLYCNEWYTYLISIKLIINPLLKMAVKPRYISLGGLNFVPRILVVRFLFTISVLYSLPPPPGGLTLL